MNDLYGSFFYLILQVTIMSRTKNHSNGDKVRIKKNRSGCKSIPRKEHREGALNNKYLKKKDLAERITMALVR